MSGDGQAVQELVLQFVTLFWIKSKPRRNEFCNYEMDVVEITQEQLVSLKWVTDSRNLAITISQNLVEKLYRLPNHSLWVHSYRCGENNVCSLTSNFQFATPVIFAVYEMSWLFFFNLDLLHNYNQMQETIMQCFHTVSTVFSGMHITTLWYLLKIIL